MNGDLPAIPCGLVAKSYFNDTFELIHMDKDESGHEKENPVSINTKSIAWSSDLDFKFSNIKENLPEG